jgi:hypothetical protein
MNDVVQARTREQRDYWKDMCGVYKARAEALENLVMRIDGRMGHGWTLSLANALTPVDGGVDGA